jgi:acyl-CoA thioesterase YciA
MTATPNRIPRIRVVMLPKDTNAMGNIFGGVILSHLDLAAAEHAFSIAERQFVTKIIREVDFIAPVHVGDTVSYYTETVRIGKTSVTIRVDVEAERRFSGEGPQVKRKSIKVTTAEVIMVAVDKDERPVPIAP